MAEKVKKQHSCLGMMLKALIIVVIIAVVLFAGVYAYFRFAFNVDMFDVIGKLQAFNRLPKESSLINYSDSDLTAFTDALDNSFGESGLGLFYDFDENGNIILNTTPDPVPPEYAHMENNLRLTGAQLAAFLSSFFNAAAESDSVDLQGKSLSDLGFRLLQISFGDIGISQITGNKTMQLNVIFCIDLTPIKARLNVFPLSLINGLIPQKLYVNSTTLIEKTGSFSYDVTHVSISVNTLTAAATLATVNMINNFIKFDITEINASIGTMFADMIIGNGASTGDGGSATGFVSLLKDIGAIGYDFVSDSGTSYLEIKC